MINILFINTLLSGDILIIVCKVDILNDAIVFTKWINRSVKGNK